MSRDTVLYKVGDNLMNYIYMLGFKHQINPTTHKRYYKNRKGNQLRVDFKRKEIALLDRSGYLISKTKQIALSEINQFAKMEMPSSEGIS